MNEKERLKKYIERHEKKLENINKKINRIKYRREMNKKMSYEDARKERRLTIQITKFEKEKTKQLEPMMGSRDNSYNIRTKKRMELN